MVSRRIIKNNFGFFGQLALQKSQRTIRYPTAILFSRIKPLQVENETGNRMPFQRYQRRWDAK